MEIGTRRGSGEFHVVEVGHGTHLEKKDDQGNRIWVEPTEDEYDAHGLSSESGAAFDPDSRGHQHDHRNSSMGGELNRVFNWRDPAKGINTPVVSYPDRLIPGLKCPDCGYPACETDQVGVALCTGTPGWFFYYRQMTDGIGKPETKLKLVNGEYQEVTEYNPVKIERDPLGDFKEKNEEESDEE